MSCPVCFDPCLTKLLCGHVAHKECVLESGTARQELLIANDKPPEKCATCPICRSPQPNIPLGVPSWFGKLIIEKTCIEELVKVGIENNYFVPVKKVPEEIATQMTYATELNVAEFANTIFIASYFKACQSDVGMSGVERMVCRVEKGGHTRFQFMR